MIRSDRWLCAWISCIASMARTQWHSSLIDGTLRACVLFAHASSNFNPKQSSTHTARQAGRQQASETSPSAQARQADPHPRHTASEANQAKQQPPTKTNGSPRPCNQASCERDWTGARPVGRLPPCLPARCCVAVSTDLDSQLMDRRGGRGISSAWPPPLTLS